MRGSLNPDGPPITNNEARTTNNEQRTTSTAALIPIKRLADAKSRLAPHLDAEQRIQLARTLLDRAVRAARESGRIHRLAISTPEREVAEAYGGELVPDRGSLNASLEEGQRWAMRIAAARLLILPADLAAVEPADIRAFIDSTATSPGIGICATLDGGTGALLLTPPDVIAPAFGPDSFQRHVRLARDRGVAAQIVNCPGVALDIDTIEDLRAAGLEMPNRPNHQFGRLL